MSVDEQQEQLKRKNNISFVRLELQFEKEFCIEGLKNKTLERMKLGVLTI